MYKLVWKDKFLIDGKPDSNIWNLETGGHGFGNNEDQFYTNNLKNAFVENGILNIVAYKEDFENRHYTSAKLTTYGKKSINKGRIVVKAKLPKGKGTWPAIWLLPNSIQTEKEPWPLCGEIDIVEHVGRNPNVIHFSLHSEKYNHRKNNHKTHFVENTNIYDDFVSYEIRWDENKITYYVDEIKQVEFYKDESAGNKEWPFDKPYYLIINLAIGGTWGGEVDDSIFPVAMQISSVEVYEKS